MNRRRLHIELIKQVATEFGDLLPKFVFVGGSVAGILITDPSIEDVRPTDDVDVVVAVGNYAKYAVLQEQLRARNFKHVMDGPNCRFKVGEIIVDVMPTDETILGFNNRWYPVVTESATEMNLEGTLIRIISAPLFICTKLEAFADRGKNDFLMSHDIEDVVSIIDGRAELFAEVAQSDDAVKAYLHQQFDWLINNVNFMDAVPGMVSGGPDREERFFHRMSLLLNFATDIGWSIHRKMFVLNTSPYELLLVREQGMTHIGLVDPILLKSKPLWLLERLHQEARTSAEWIALLWGRPEDMPERLPMEDEALGSQVAVYNWNAQNGLNRLRLLRSGNVFAEYNR